MYNKPSKQKSWFLLSILETIPVLVINPFVYILSTLVKIVDDFIIKSQLLIYYYFYINFLLTTKKINKSIYWRFNLRSTSWRRFMRRKKYVISTNYTIRKNIIIMYWILSLVNTLDTVFILRPSTYVFIDVLYLLDIKKIH